MADFSLDPQAPLLDRLLEGASPAGLRAIVRAQSRRGRRIVAQNGRIEDVARCGWRSFVSRVLRVEPAPDPLGALPALSRLLIGQVVHDVLELAVKRQLGAERPGTLPEALAAGPVRVQLPPAGELREAFRTSVERRASEAGLPLGAFAEVVAGRAAELYETARTLELPQDGYRILANTGANAHQEVPHLHVHIFGGKQLGPMLAN